MKQKIISRLRKFDWLIIFPAMIISVFGLMSIFSSSGDDFSSFWKQLSFFGIGILAMFFFSFVDWRVFRENPFLILVLYFLCLAGLAGLFFFAPEIRGVRSWYKIGGLSVDPIEFMKVALILLMAKYFSMRHIEMYRIRHIMFSGIYFIAPSLLIFFQPNLGPVIVLFFIWVIILIISGIKLRHFILLLLAMLAAASAGWIFLLKDYQKERVIVFLKPHEEPLGKGWNQNQAKIAIGSGGLFGKGLGKGSQTQYGFLPEPQTDFVFSALAEETGFAGILTIFGLYILLVWRIIRMALSGRTNFIRIFSAGFAAVIVSQIFINVGMNLGVLPVIGIPLPFASYGGSGLISMFIFLGILQSIKVNSSELA